MDSESLAGLVREKGLDVFERMFRAVELVQQRLNRACHALHEAQVPYAVIGGNAVVRSRLARPWQRSFAHLGSGAC